MSIADALASAGKTPAAFAKDDPIGTVVGGTIAAANIRQVMGYDDDKPEFWDEAKTQPKQQVVITIQTDKRDPGIEGDDGRRNIYIKWWGDQRKELVRGVKAAGDSDTRVGGKFAARKAGTIPSDNPKFADAIIWQYSYEKPATGLDFGSMVNEQVNTQTGEVSPAQAQQNFAAGLGATVVQPAAAAPVAQPAAAAPQGWQMGGVPAPVAAAPAATAPAVDVDKVKQFLALGMTDEQVAAAADADPAVVAAIRNAP